MKWKTAICLLTCVACMQAGHADTQVVEDSSEFIDQQDVEALREWLATKRQVSIRQLGGDLSLSGEIRAEMQRASEHKKGVQQRGYSAGFNKPKSAYDIEVNLMLDYRSDKAWGSIKLEFDNDAGSVFNVFDGVTVERAYFGGRVLSGDTYTIDIECGRRNFGTVFDSRVQFGSFMDGVLLKVDKAWDNVGDLYFHGGPFLINERRSQYGFVGEIAILNIANTGLYAKYSLIDWKTKHYLYDNTTPAAIVQEKEALNRLYSFINSQWTAGYKFVPSRLQKTVTLYGAYLHNHAPKQTAVTRFLKQNSAWYVGGSIGKVRNKGDWSFNMNYQYVQAQSVPSFDASGIGKGNVQSIGLYTRNLNGTGTLITDATVAVGKANYKGFAAELLYLLTDSVTVSQSFQFAKPASGKIGPSMIYRQYEIEFIYAF